MKSKLTLSIILIFVFCFSGFALFAEGEKAEEERAIIGKPGEGIIIYAQMGGSPGKPCTDPRVLGAKAAAEQWGCKLIQQFSDWQSDVMITQFKEAIAARPDGIIIMGHPGEDAFRPFVDEAVSKGIIVTSNNTPLPGLESKYVGKGFGYVGLDLYKAGHMLASQVIMMAGLKRGDKVFNYGLKAQPTRGLIDIGIEDRCKEVGINLDYVEISEEVNADASLAIPVVTGYLSANPDCKAMIIFHGILTSIAAEMITAAGLDPDDIFFGGCDLGPKTIEAIRAGYVDVIIDQQIYLQGFIPIEQICLTKLYKLSGLNINTGSGFVTPDNIESIIPLIEKGIR